MLFGKMKTTMAIRSYLSLRLLQAFQYLVSGYSSRSCRRSQTNRGSLAKSQITSQGRPCCEVVPLSRARIFSGGGAQRTSLSNHQSHWFTVKSPGANPIDFDARFVSSFFGPRLMPWSLSSRDLRLAEPAKTRARHTVFLVFYLVWIGYYMSHLDMTHTLHTSYSGVSLR